MDVHKLTETVSVAPQLTVREIAEAARLGFRTLINNRPDGEDPGQPSARALEAAAREQGIEYHHQPVVSGALNERDVHAFRELLAQAAQPVLAFCRTGTRCTMLWALAQSGSQPTDEILATAERAGYDVSSLRSVIEHGI
jgi:uncharacterized protein (TIGR01244 family)